MLDISPATCTATLSEQYHQVRNRTLELTQGLSVEDMMLQSMPDASPTKWHLAHTTWFFEQFILSRWVNHYRCFDPNFNFLFNSYYESVGERHPRPIRGLLSRPSHQQVLDYRTHVDRAIGRLAVDLPLEEDPELSERLIIGLHHEMQHQELILTDIKHALAQNTVMQPRLPADPPGSQADRKFSTFSETLTTVGADETGFSYDCERPRHRVFLERFELRNSPISNGEWLAFMADGGYHQSSHWLSDGWDLCQENAWQAPLYWHYLDGEWHELTFWGYRPVNSHAPVCHISFYEADAFCRWAGWRLPTEFEWEYGAARASAPSQGHYAESGHWHPKAASGKGLQQFYGDVWEWTSSAYCAYPGFTPAQGALGEYNGKFMANQFVLRGGSCATARDQMRPSYRNFFYPHQRWQFSGVRPAR